MITYSNTGGEIMNKKLTIFNEDTKHGTVEWRWKTTGEPSAMYKSFNYQWWFPKKTDFEVLTRLSTEARKEVRDEIWGNMQEEIEYFKRFYKMHKDNKKRVKNET